MQNLHRSPQYRKHENHQMRLVKAEGKHQWRLECAECKKKNFIAWLDQQQAILVDQLILESQT